MGATSTDNMLHSFDAATGRELWAADLGTNQGAGMLFSPAAADGVIYIGSSAESIYALDSHRKSNLAGPYLRRSLRRTGSGEWGCLCSGRWHWLSSLRLQCGHGTTAMERAAGGGHSSPAVVDGIVYVGSTDNNLYALNAATGQLVWKQLTESADSPPAVANGVVYRRLTICTPWTQPPAKYSGVPPRVTRQGLRRRWPTRWFTYRSTTTTCTPTACLLKRCRSPQPGRIQRRLNPI